LSTVATENDFDFELHFLILDSIQEDERFCEEDFYCPGCGNDSLFKFSDCFARCRTCGAIIVASTIPMPECYKTSWKNIRKLKECYGKNDFSKNTK